MLSMLIMQIMCDVKKEIGLAMVKLSYGNKKLFLKHAR